MSDNVKATNEATSDQSGGSAHLTPAEALLIAAYRTQDMESIARTLGRMAAAKEGKTADDKPLALSKYAFHRLSVYVLNTLLLNFVEPDELHDRFEPVFLLAQIEGAIREGLLNNAVDHMDLQATLELLGY